MPVPVVGAGPVGLTLAMELEHHVGKTLLVERNTSTTRHPKRDVTNSRSMELYRRLGVADDLRKVADPCDRRTEVTWATDSVGWELASFDYPKSAGTPCRRTQRNLGGSPHARGSGDQCFWQPRERDPWHRTRLPIRPLTRPLSRTRRTLLRLSEHDVTVLTDAAAERDVPSTLSTCATAPPTGSTSATLFSYDPTSTSPGEATPCQPTPCVSSTASAVRTPDPSCPGGCGT